MKNTFYSTIKKNIELLPVFIPVILSLSSWTLYKVINNDQKDIKIVKTSHQYPNSFKINCDFLKPSKNADVSEKSILQQQQQQQIADDYLASDSTIISDHWVSNQILSNTSVNKSLTHTTPFSDNFNSTLAKSGYIGEIGNMDFNRRDANASDNIFDVKLSAFDPNKSYVLTYEIDGYSNVNSVTRSINGSYAMGGYIKSKNSGWTEISESIDPSILKKGDNKILFNAFNKGDYYTIKNVQIKERQNDLFSPYKIVSKVYNDKIIYIRGFVNSQSGIQSIDIQGEKIDLQGNEFEYISKGNGGNDPLIIKFKSLNNVSEMTVEKTEKNSGATEISSFDTKGQRVVFHNAAVIVKGLRIIDLPPSDLSTINVSSEYEGFRFISKTSKEEEFRLSYDESKLPKGYQEKDINAFNFDYQKKQWLPIKIDSLNTAKKYIVLHSSLSKGDFMVGVTKQPESPEGGGHAQTSFNDSPIANPASKINFIAPPTPNQQGSANVSYPIEIPAGIGGFQPKVSLVYNSDNKFGWAGTGWDIPVETIDIDTRWGVPSFGSNETEIYLIAGEQLVFRDDYLPNKLPYAEARVANRRFYYRNGIKEGYFITRKGGSPSNYTWETLDGTGTKKEYLEVLTNNPSGNSSGNVIKWFLSKVTDRFGNTITYSYIDSFNGGGKNKYLSKITYSNNTVIEFENEGGVRGDMTLNYKLGVKLTDAKILNKITVKRANVKIREYQLVNTDVGLFSKRLLTEIIQKDGNGNIFNKHTLAYAKNIEVFGKLITKVYNTPKDNANAGSFSGGNTSFISGTYSKNKNIRGAVSFGGGFCFFLGINKKGTLGVTGSYDDNRAYGKNQLVDIDGDGLLDKVFYGSNGNINFRKNTRTGFSGVYSSIGLPGGTPLYRHNTYNTTLGLEYSFANGVVGANVSFGNSNSPTYFSDVNGDGLVDMVNYGDVYFSKIRNGVPQFQSQSVGSTFNVTEETPNAILAGSAARQDTIITTIGSKSLANVVRMWEAPVSGNIKISNDVVLIQNSQDGVEVWIERGKMRKIDEDISGYNPAISTVISPIITLNNQGPSQALNTSVYVEKGQRIFIVASSKGNEIGDRVNVDTNIEYTSIPTVPDLGLQDANNNNYFKFNAKSHYLASSQKQNIVADQNRVSISWNKLDHETFTDDVDFKIYMSTRRITDTASVISPSSATLIYHHKLLKGDNQHFVNPASNQISNIDITNLSVNPSGQTITMFHFDVSADTNVSWEKIKWRPTMAVINPTDTTQIFALVQYNPYSERLINTLPQDFRKYSRKQICNKDCVRCPPDTSYLFPDFNGNQSIAGNYTINLSSSHNTTVTFSLKIRDGYGNVYTEKNTVNVVNNVMAIPKISICALLKKTVLRPEELFSYPFYFEISSADYVVAKQLSSVNPYIFHSDFLSDPYLANTDHKADYFGARSANTHYNTNTGLVYQGWGGFSYNGSKYPNEAIYESLFASNPLANVPLPGGASPCNPSAPDYYTCLTNYILQQNNNRYFTPLELDAEKYAYVSPLEPVELGEADLQSYMLGVSSSSSTIITTPLFAVPNPRGIILRSTFDSVHAYASGSFIPWLGISAHGGISTDRTSDYFQDFNGDGYPDIISGKYYQKTNFLGQLDTVSSIAEKEVKSKGFILGAGISASASVAKFSNTDSKFFAIGAEKDSHTGSSSFGLGIGVGINIGKAWTEGTGVWADINGDGLIDYISEGYSYINTGNGFAVDNYSWDVSEVSKGDSFAVSGGGGFSFANGSWAAGVGLSKSSFNAKTGLIDVNGDGLADKIVKNGNTYEMWINNGTSFIPPKNFNKQFSLDNKQNASGFNLYGTLCGCFGVKICISVGGGTDNSVSKQEVDLRDFDGDGYPDLLISEDDTQLTYYHNEFPRANLLLTIENPLQGLITIAYSNVNEENDLATLIGGTYQMPFSKTVMSRVYIWNFRPLDTTLPFLGPFFDPQKIKIQQRFDFEYEKGIQDRRERAFLGFGIVKTKIYNDQTLHQTHVTQYETDYTGNESNFYVNFDDSTVRQYFYKKGIVRSSYMLDSQNRKRSETKYTYKYFNAPNAVEGYSMDDSQPEPKYKDIGRIIPLLYKTESTFTEFSGSASHSKTTINVTDTYDQYGNLLRSVDKRSSLANTADDVRTDISYHPPGAKNIVGTPSEQTVYAHNGFMRKTTTILDANQNIKQIKKDILGTGPNGSSGTSNFDMEYDSYGNMTKVTYPESENGQRMFYNYVYDPVYHTYLLSTNDAYEFTSSTQYDSNYLFGVPVAITGINGATSEYTYDSFGRITEYLAPSDTKWTVKMHYYPSNTIPVAITERKLLDQGYDPNNPFTDNYFTSLFTDCWGEGIMSKKLFKKENGNYYFANNIYQIKDKLGRPVKTILRDKVTTGYDITTSLKLFDDYTTAENQSAQIYSTTTTYDDLDRPISITQHNVTTNNGLQNLTTQMFYEFGKDRYGDIQFSTRVVSPLGNTSVSYTDEFGRTTSSKLTGGNNDIWVSYRYNRLNELLAMEDAGNHATLYEYDKLGRNVKKTEPDAGESNFEYDMSGKLIRLDNANLKAITEVKKYLYNYDQLAQVIYPDHNILFEYGQQAGTETERGRLVKQTDRTGTQNYKYDIFGNVIENRRIVVAPRNVPKMFKTSYDYDIFGRIKQITYPDTELVTYVYNMSGLLDRVLSKSPGRSHQVAIAYEMTYNNRDQMTSYLSGNGTKTSYNYDPWGKVNELSLLYTNGNINIRKNQYTFDGNENLVNVQGTTPMTGNFPINQLAIATNKQYSYDSFGRLGSAQITAKGKEFTKYYKLDMGYNVVGNMELKDSKLKTYYNSINCQYPNNEGDAGIYKYENPDYPNAVSSIDYKKYLNFNAPLDCGISLSVPLVTSKERFYYDLNGNLNLSEEIDQAVDVNLDHRQMFWDYDNRLRAVVTQKENLNYYAYDAAGDRVLKNDAVSKNLYINGNDPNTTTQMGAFTYYPNGFLVLSDKTMSKHYYMGGQRIATRVSEIPTHRFKIDLSGDYRELADALGEEIHNIIIESGLPGEVWVSNEDSQGTYTTPTAQTNYANHCPFLMEQQMYTFLQDGNEECYNIMAEYYQKALDDGDFCHWWTMFMQEKADCMINYTPPEYQESEMYWIHPDHFSGASILVDKNGAVTNWYEYMPYGEMLMENTDFSYDNPYKYNAKEFDMATGYYYYGARYYDPKRSFWLSVDPLAEITMSPYAYVWNDPVNFTDPTGLMGERVGGPKDGPKTVKDCFGSQNYSTHGPGDSLDAYIKSKGGLNAFGPQKPAITKNGWQNTFELWNYKNELAHWNKLSYKEKQEQARLNAGIELLNEAFRPSAQAIADLFTIQASLGGSGLESGITRRVLQKRFRPKIDLCFVAGTPISTSDGFKKIEEIKIGDLVWSYNESNKNTELKKVVSTTVNDVKSLVLINIGNIKIECTLEHPFYVNGNWVEAKDLKIGDELMTKDGKLSVITSVMIEEKSEKVYNFEVEDNHNYYVSENAILVHNTCWKERLAKFMEYVSKIDPKSLKSQDETVKHLESVFKMLDKTRTDDNILILVKPDKSNVKFLEKGVMRIDQKNAGDATIIYPNGGFQIYQKSKLIINKIK